MKDQPAANQSGYTLRGATPRRCPSHPSQPYEDCQACEARIAHAELAAADGSERTFIRRPRRR